MSAMENRTPAELLRQVKEEDRHEWGWWEVRGSTELCSTCADQRAEENAGWLALNVLSAWSLVPSMGFMMQSAASLICGIGCASASVGVTTVITGAAIPLVATNAWHSTGRRQPCMIRLSGAEVADIAETIKLNEDCLAALKTRNGNISHAALRAKRASGVGKGLNGTAFTILAAPLLTQERLKLSWVERIQLSGCKLCGECLGFSDWASQHASSKAFSAPKLTWVTYGGEWPSELSKESGSGSHSGKSGDTNTPPPAPSSSDVPNPTSSQTSNTPPLNRAISLSTIKPLMTLPSKSSLPSTRLTENLMDLRVSSLPTVINGYSVQDDTFTDDSTERPQKCAVKFGPSLADKTFYANTPENSKKAYDERYTKKALPFTMTGGDKLRVVANVDAILEHVFSGKMIHDAVEDLGFYDNLKSKKWNEQRFRTGIEALLAKNDPEVRVAMGIKVEPSKPDKAPRFLLADGDAGQLQALAIVAVIERCWFKWFKKNNIKGRPKEDAIEEIVKHLCLNDQKNGQCVVENDGTAWDSCCNLEIRDLITNRAIDHVSTIVHTYGWCNPQQWSDMYSILEHKPKLKVKVGKDKPGLEKTKMHIDAFMRSGCRGTSIFNGIVNKTMSLLSIFENPFLNEDGTSGGLLYRPNAAILDRWGKKRRSFDAEEGDDSTISISGKLSTAQINDILGFWTRGGFNMKLKVPKFVSEFCGWKILLDGNGVPTGDAVPDVLRMMGQYGYSIARETIDGCSDDGSLTSGARQVLAAKLDSYARNCRFLPTLRTFFERERDVLAAGEEIVYTDDLKRKLQEEDDFQALQPCLRCDYRWEEPVDCRSGNPKPVGTIGDEERILIHAGIVADSEEYRQWANGISSITLASTSEDLVAVGWRDYRD